MTKPRPKGKQRVGEPLGMGKHEETNSINDAYKWVHKQTLQSEEEKDDDDDDDEKKHNTHSTARCECKNTHWTFLSQVRWAERKPERKSQQWDRKK